MTIMTTVYTQASSSKKSIDSCRRMVREHRNAKIVVSCNWCKCLVRKFGTFLVRYWVYLGITDCANVQLTVIVIYEYIHQND